MLFKIIVKVPEWGGHLISTRFPSIAPRVLGKFHFLKNLLLIVIHSSYNDGLSTKGRILPKLFEKSTLEIPTLNSQLKFRNDPPCAKYLSVIAKQSSGHKNSPATSLQQFRIHK